MFFSRRQMLRQSVGQALALSTIGSLCQSAQAQDPTPIRLLVGFPAGGGSDAIARILAEKLKDELGAPVVVDNRGGAGGQIAAQALKTAAPDGHTFFITHDHTISIVPQVVKNPGFDPQRDFVAVAGFASFANGLAVSGKTPASSFKEYLGWVRQHQQGTDTIGVPAPASIPEFLVQLLRDKYQLDLQAAPYRGSAPMIADMLGNQIHAGIAGLPDFIENHKTGKIRMLAVIGDKRQSIVPDVPTFAELGLAGLEDLPYYGFFAPVGTPQPVLDRFSAALAKVLTQADVHERLSALGLSVGFMPQKQFASHVQRYTQTWERIIQASGFKPQ